MNNKQRVEKSIKKPESIGKGYLDIIENTLKTFKEQKKADIHYLDNIEHTLETYKKELEYMDKKNKEMHNKILKLIKHKKVLDNKVKEDLKKTDKHIQLIKIQKEL
ncbi:hypothetical protein [Methanobacterium veterum]|uniref:Uncharacterized protein n=2 Tax=Methanobacterium TaxID=2160 RepID=A0A9E4ZSW0_9EURY|nr:hypothetical protein [Methanobacterium veterum]MCZ3364519.1 hypothetical protein [Methanobacterium veterum]MCZ3372272.1 hypothetical protein [Methanobacterium veterum]